MTTVARDTSLASHGGYRKHDHGAEEVEFGRLDIPEVGAPAYPDFSLHSGAGRSIGG